jgi:hypothetical protein
MTPSLNLVFLVSERARNGFLNEGVIEVKIVLNPCILIDMEGVIRMVILCVKSYIL